MLFNGKGVVGGKPQGKKEEDANGKKTDKGRKALSLRRR